MKKKLYNNLIQRNNFKTDRESGSIIFDKKQSLNSKVTVSIFGSDYYRIGLKVEDYDSTSSKIYNFVIELVNVTLVTLVWQKILFQIQI